MKNTSIPLDKFFKIIKPSYVYIKITPHKSVRNYNSSNIAKSIALSWRAINKQIRLEKKKLWVECNFKVSYIIDIKEGNASFYFIVPEIVKSILLEKISEIWSKCTVEETEPIQDISVDSTKYEVYYKKEDALSLSVDKKSNEPLNSILSVMDIMQDDDRVTICYNFHPTTQYGWQERYDNTITSYKAKKPVDKDKTSFGYILKASINFIAEMTDIVVEVLNDFLGGKPKKTNNVTFAESLATAMESAKELSVETKKKKEQTILDTEIVVVSKSNDRTREINNSHSVCTSYRAIDGDNELKYKNFNKVFNYEDNWWGCTKNQLSVDEAQNFIQVPGRMLLTQLGIKHVNVNENIVPEELQKGNKRLGIATHKGNKTNAYLEDDYNIGNLPTVLIGSQGSGKSTLDGNIAKDGADAGESVIVIDFIKNCELSETIKKYVPLEKLVEIDLANKKTIQGLGYNEIKIEANMSAFEKLNLANLQAQQIMSLIDAVSVGDPLSSRMRRFLSSAANVVFVQGYSSVKDVVKCLEDYKARYKFVNGLDNNLRMLLEDELNTLDELNEYSKVSKKEELEGIVPEIVGTLSSKIEHILDRIAMLREDFKLKYMYNKDLNNNINIVECMEQGKVILFKMRESDFPTRMIKNVVVTYLYTKIWLSAQLRGSISEKPLRCNVIVDEVFQAPQVLKMLEYILPQCRKFGLHNVFSTQYIGQLDCIFDSLEASGASYMLLKGSLEDDFKHFSSKLEGFEYEDLRDMEKYHSLNLIYYSGGYASFITKLPRPL